MKLLYGEVPKFEATAIRASRDRGLLYETVVEYSTCAFGLRRARCPCCHHYLRKRETWDTPLYWCAKCRILWGIKWEQ